MSTLDINAIPAALREGENWELLDLDSRWIWLARGWDDRIVGVLIAAPCHGLAFIWRVKILPDAPPWSLGRLLRRFIRDLRARRCLGYLACLDLVGRPQEQALARIAFRAGALSSGATTMVCGSVNARHVPEEGD